MSSHVVGLDQYAVGHPVLCAPMDISEVSGDVRRFGKLRRVLGHTQKGLPSLKGLGFLLSAYPALKRWAMICRPTLWDSDNVGSGIQPSPRGGVERWARLSAWEPCRPSSTPTSPNAGLVGDPGSPTPSHANAARDGDPGPRLVPFSRPTRGLRPGLTSSRRCAAESGPVSLIFSRTRADRVLTQTLKAGEATPFRVAALGEEQLWRQNPTVLVGY